MDFPTALTFLGLLVAIGGAGGSLLAGSRRSGASSTPIALGLFAYVTLWAIGVALLARGNVFLATVETPAPKVLLGWLPGFALLAVVGLSPTLLSFLRTLPTTLLVGLHVSRIATGMAMIHAALTGSLAMVFALPAGLGGLLVGGPALGCLLLMSRGTPQAHVWTRRWNAFGILDIVLAMALGGLTGPGSPPILTQGIPGTAASAYPLAIIPAFLVPLYLLVHVLLRHQLPRHERV